MKTYWLYWAGVELQGRSVIDEGKAIDLAREFSLHRPDKVMVLGELITDKSGQILGTHSLWFDGKRFTPHSYVEQLEAQL